MDIANIDIEQVCRVVVWVMASIFACSALSLPWVAALYFTALWVPVCFLCNSVVVIFCVLVYGQHRGWF